jgi:hypothetical protein
MSATLEQVFRATNRLSYTEAEVRFAIEFVKQNRAKGLLTSIHRSMGEQPRPHDHGIFVIEAADLATDFIFVKIDAGRGLLGGQKARFLSYLGQVRDDVFDAGPSFGTFGLALTNINNIYRALGLL